MSSRIWRRQISILAKRKTSCFVKPLSSWDSGLLQEQSGRTMRKSSMYWTGQLHAWKKAWRNLWGLSNGWISLFGGWRSMLGPWRRWQAPNSMQKILNGDLREKMRSIISKKLWCPFHAQRILTMIPHICCVYSRMRVVLDLEPPCSKVKNGRWPQLWLTSPTWWRQRNAITRFTSRNCWLSSMPCKSGRCFC